jgi:3-hydroxybutyryl-CoA dehydrogenase
MEIKTIGILGAGAMGGGIAQVAAQAGFLVKICDVDMKFVDRALGRISGFLGKSVEKGKITGDQRDEIMGRITPCAGMEEFSGADMVIEAIMRGVQGCALEPAPGAEKPDPGRQAGQENRRGLVRLR